MSTLRSHPNILLRDHLEAVALRASELILELEPFLCLSVPVVDLARAAFIAGCTHDFGKAKRQFQQYITHQKGANKDKEHSAVSSVFAFLVATSCFRHSAPHSKFLPFVCAYAVNRSHAALCNIESAFEEHTIIHQVQIARQSIAPEVWDFKFESERLGLTVRFCDYKADFQNKDIGEVVNRFQRFAFALRGKAKNQTAYDDFLVDLYLSLLLLVASLTEADIGSVIDAPSPNVGVPLDHARIYNYAFSKPKASGFFQTLRERAWAQIQREVAQLPQAFRLTLPTGLGKTLMGLYLAATVQEKDKPRPVVYALPYLSIIEQTSSEARRIFENNEVKVLEHHSLSFPKTGEAEGEVPNYEKARFLLEEWDGDLVVTTFDQLFYSFLSSDRGFIRRFVRLPGSVLVLDEVQTIPARLIPVVETFLEKIRDKLKAKVIHMTATHPPFLGGIPSLVADEKPYFEHLKRTRLHLCLKPTPLSEFLETLPEWLVQRKGKKVLIVANTIRCAWEICNRLWQAKGEDESLRELELFYLSGSVVPIERLERIENIRELSKNNPRAWICVVATQCVEAGVDLDMDEGIRDFAPWDSLLQACGRVNRFGKRPCADVWVYRWVDDRTGREFHSYIYDSVFCDATLEVIKEKGVLDEGDYFGVHQRYVQALQSRLSTEKSFELLQTALSWQFEDLDFQALFRGAERAWKVSVFCIADETAEQLREIAIALWAEKNGERAFSLTLELCRSQRFERLARFLRVQGEVVAKLAEGLKALEDRQLRLNLARLVSPMFHAYTVSLSVQRLENLPHFSIGEGFKCLDKEVYNSLDCTKPSSTSSPWWIL